MKYRENYQMKVKSIEDLRLFLEAERSDTGRGRVGNKALAVLEDMLNRPGAAAVDSISQIATNNGVDPSTVTRLGKRLGYSGFTELQGIFRRYVTQTQPFYSARIHERVLDTQDNTQPELLRLHAEAECRKLLAVSDQIDSQRIEQAASLLANAKNVFLLGLRATYGISFFLGTYLSTIRENVYILGGPGHALTSDLMAIKEGDLLVALSFRPYTRNVVTAVHLARDIDAKVLSITDVESPLEVPDDKGVTITVDQPFYFDSSTAHFFVVQTILLATAKCIGPAAVELAERRERIDKALNIEIR
jgi:DNA-binding MurR/RpiR family transcriptional regulator